MKRVMLNVLDSTSVQKSTAYGVQEFSFDM